MINPFKLKELFAFIVPQFISIVGFMIILPTYGFLMASMSSILLITLGVVIGKLIITHPFLDMLKGNGIMTLTIDSKGIINPFLTKFHKGSLISKFQGEKINAPFDRKAVFNLTEPKDMEGRKDEEGNIWVKISQDDFNKSRMALYHYPVLLYNQQMNSLITKDWLSERETETFSRHHIIHANKIAERLTEQITNFGRYIADHSMNKIRELMGNPLIRTILIAFVVILVGIMLFKFAPQILGTAQDTLTKATVGKATQTITPVG